jgi:hypothetical protein
MGKAESVRYAVYGAEADESESRATDGNCPQAITDSVSS